MIMKKYILVTLWNRLYDHSFMKQYVHLSGVVNTLKNLSAANAVSWKKMRTTRYDATHTDSDYLRTILRVSSWRRSASHACCRIMCRVLEPGTIHVRRLFLNLQCPVRSWPFTGTHRFLAGLFTFLSRQPVVIHLRASEKNWFRTSTTKKKKKKKKSFLCCSCDILLSCLLSLYPSSVHFAYIRLHF